MDLTKGGGRLRLAVAMTALVSAAAIVMPGDLASAQGDVHLVVQAGSAKAVFLNVGRPALRLGDRLSGRGPLLDATTLDRVGVAHQDCVVMREITDGPDGFGGLYWCRYVLELELGDIVVEGLDPHGPGVYTFVVVGGTEGYAGVSGDATLTDTLTETEFVIDLPA